jgi:Uma2 family endonuclease
VRQPAKQSAFEDDVLLHIPEGGFQYEWVRGEIMAVSEPDPIHGYVGVELAAVLRNHVKAHDLGKVFGLDTFFLVRRLPRTVYGADIAFVAKDRMTEPLAHGVWAIAPDLVAEVRSPSDRRGIMQKKVADYIEAGVRLVWVVDPKARTVNVHRIREPVRVLSAADSLDGEDVVPGFRCSVASLFP